jgi:hypothetical protein
MFLSDFNQALIFWTFLIEFNENPPSRTRVDADGQADRHERNGDFSKIYERA